MDVQSTFDLNFDKSLYAEGLAPSTSPLPWLTAVPSGLVSSSHGHLCPSNVFPIADLIMLL